LSYPARRSRSTRARRLHHRRQDPREDILLWLRLAVGEYVNLISKGIIDRQSRACGDPERGLVAALLITTEAMVAEVPKKNAGSGMLRVAAAWAAWVVWISKSNRSELNNKKARSDAGFLLVTASRPS